MSRCAACLLEKLIFINVTPPPPQKTLNRETQSECNGDKSILPLFSSTFWVLCILPLCLVAPTTNVYEYGDHFLVCTVHGTFCSKLEISCVFHSQKW